MLISFFCKKGGVGKTTATGEYAGYLTSMGKKVLIISVDDQNSLFEMFGLSGKVFERDDNYLEHYVAGTCAREDVLIPLRENLYGVIQETQGLLEDRKLHIGDNDLLKVHLLNSAIKMSVERGRGKLVKLSPNDHIDGAASLIDAMTVRQKHYAEIGDQLKNEG